MQIGKLNKHINFYINNYQLNDYGEKERKFSALLGLYHANVDFTGGAEGEKDNVRQSGATVDFTIRYFDFIMDYVKRDLVISYDGEKYDVMSYQLIDKRFIVFKCQQINSVG